MSALIKESPTLNAQFGKAPTPADMLSLIRSFGGTFTRQVSGDPAKPVDPDVDSPATYVDNLGIVRRAKSGYPRPNFVDGVNKGVLIEEQRTNLLLRSEEFDNAVWAKTGTTVSPNTAIAPDGNTVTPTADSLIPSATTEPHFTAQTITLTSGVTYTQTYFVKSNGYDFIQIHVAGTALGGGRINFRLSTSEVTISDTGISGTILGLGNNWYRISATRLASGSTSVANFAVGPVTTANAPYRQSYLGDGTSGIFIWGAQLEAGSFPTSYIPTAGTTVTRGAEECIVSDAEDKINQTEGTIVCTFDATDMPLLNLRIVGIGANINNSISLSVRTNLKVRVEISSPSGDLVSVLNSSNNYISGKNTVVLCYKSGDYRLFLNGVKTSSESELFPVGEMNRIQFSSLVYYNNIAHLGKPSERVLLYPTYLTDEQALLLSRL